MIFSLDYDKTYTEDPKLWDKFVEMATTAGHSVVCLTMRHPHETIVMPCPVVYTCRKAKKLFADANGIRIDVWIDDSPRWLLTDG